MRRKLNQELEVEETKDQSQDLLSQLTAYLHSESDVTYPPQWFLDTGNLALNYIISGRLDGGWPSGQVAEIFGDPSTGKTLLEMKAVAKLQEIGGLAIVDDVEHRWDWNFAKLHGVNPDLVAKDHPETVEDFTIRTDKILDAVLAKDPIPKVAIFLDSIASLSTYWEMENVGMKEDQGKKAKRIKASMRVLPKKIAKAGAILLTSNHLIANPQITYGSPYITPGGKGITFQSSIRVEMSKPILINMEGKNRPIGATLRLKCTKNSICPPFGETEINVFWSTGIDRLSGLIELMVDLGIITQGGGWFTYKDKPKFRAKELGEFIKDNPELLTDEIWDKPYFK